MLPLKLVRSLVFGHESITSTTSNPPLHFLPQIHNQNDTNTNNIDHQHTTTPTLHEDTSTKTTRLPLLLFLPTRELVSDTFRLATIARDLGMDLYPTPSLSHILFSYTNSLSPTNTPSYLSSSLLWSSTSLSLPNDAVPLPFPSLSSAQVSHLRSFVSLSKGLFKLVYTNNSYLYSNDNRKNEHFCGSNWDCSAFSLFSRLTRDRIESMDGFSKAMAGTGWTLFKTRKNSLKVGGKMVYLFRKVETKRARIPFQRNGHGGECRVRELRLPTLDFRNAPLRILHYILLMTDDLFYLA